MAETAIDVGAPAARETVASRIVRYISTTPVHFVLALLGLFWLVPTLGLMFTSLLAPENLLSEGWWQIFSTPEQGDVRQLPGDLRERHDHEVAVHDPPDRDRRHDPADLRRRAGGLRVRVARLPRPRLALHRRDRAARGAAADGADPDLHRSTTTPASSTRCSGLILFHTAFGLPFAIFLLRNFFIGIPKDLLEAARIDGASEIRIFLRLILPLGLPAIASLAIFQFLWTWNDLLVALTFARDTQPITVAIFSPAPRSSARTSS